MIKFFQWIYTAYSAILFVLLMLIFGLFVLIPLLISQKGDKISFVFIRLWAGIWAALSGIRFEAHGLNHINSSKPYIYIFNHRSFIDAPMIPLMIPQAVRAIGKKELSKIPVFGQVIGKLAVWVDRSDAESRGSVWKSSSNSSIREVQLWLHPRELEMTRMKSYCHSRKEHSVFL